MRARKLVGFLAVAVGLVALGPITVAPVFGEDNGTVSATVTVAAPCLTVSQTTAVDYGILGFDTLVAKSLGTVENCSGSEQRLSVRGTPATSAGGTTWEINGRNCAPPTPTLNRYHMLLTIPDASVAGYALSTFDFLVPSPMLTAANWATTGGLMMPCPGSDGAGETLNFSVIFTASFD